MAGTETRRQVQDFIKDCNRAGLTVTKTNGSHYKVYRGKAWLFSLPSTPGNQIDGVIRTHRRKHDIPEKRQAKRRA